PAELLDPAGPPPSGPQGHSGNSPGLLSVFCLNRAGRNPALRTPRSVEASMRFEAGRELARISGGQRLPSAFDGPAVPPSVPNPPGFLLRRTQCRHLRGRPTP